MELMDHQIQARDELSNGKILWGGVGTGKSATALAYYMKNECPKDIYVITTARKRDELGWEKDAAPFMLSTSAFLKDEAYLKHRGILTVDSWQNIIHYLDVKDAFFIFDEQRLVGNGVWVKAFQKIAQKNNWIMLTATPGDTWLDYAPVFIANGWYKNITDFKFKHVVYEPFHKFPKIRGYIGERKLEALRNEILVEMPYLRHTERMVNWIDVDHDVELTTLIKKKRWNPFENQPIVDAGEMYRLTRMINNSDPSRLEWVKKLMTCHNRLIIFYTFNYELDILRTLNEEIDVYEWNGHRKHKLQTFENQEKWVYLVQYVSGGEAWNCISTDAMILYSLPYSYKNFEQSMGRIDRLDTPFYTLYYYLFVSNLWLDCAIRRSLEQQKSFNERQNAIEEGLIS